MTQTQIITLIAIFNHIGIMSCSIQGVKKGICFHDTPVFHSLANAFGGGFVRDFFLLNVTPWVLSYSATPDIALVLFVALLYAYIIRFHPLTLTQQHYLNLFVTVTDYCGLIAFIKAGIDKATLYSNDVIIIILCGYSTSVCGGLCAHGKNALLSLMHTSTLCYHAVILLSCYYYYITRDVYSLMILVFGGMFLGLHFDFSYFCVRPYFGAKYTPCFFQRVNYSIKHFLKPLKNAYYVHKVFCRIPLCKNRLRIC